MVPEVDEPALAPEPETRRALVTLLTQIYDGYKTGEDAQVDVFLPDWEQAVSDLARMFLVYVAETEAEHGGDFLEFLRRQALEAFPDDGPPAADQP